MDLDPAWYDAIGRRTSVRRYDGHPVPAGTRARLEDFCARVKQAEGDRTCRLVLVEDDAEDLFVGIVGAYGGVAGTPLAALFTGVPGADTVVGYRGEAFILEATCLGLGTCWIAGSFDRQRATRLAKLRAGHRVYAVTPLGHPLERPSGGPGRGVVRASARLSVEKLAPGILDGDWPGWAVCAVQAARLAPSGGNRQPWRFRRDGDSLVMSEAPRLYWTAPLDLGIARLHVELGALHEGVRGHWEELAAPDVARFVPD